MLTSLALIFLVGLSMAAICQKCRLPRIVGMLLTGIVLGPYVLDWLDPSILSISAELRKNGTDYYPTESGTFSEYSRFEEGGTARGADVLPAGKL